MRSSVRTMLSRKKIEFKRQTIGLSEEAKQEVKAEAQRIIDSKQTSIIEKEKARLTIQKIEDIERQIAKGLRKMASETKDGSPSKISRKFANGDDLSQQFYSAEEALQERTPEFWKKPDVVKFASIKLCCRYDPETLAHYLYLYKENSKYSPTYLKVAFLELASLYDELIALQEEIMNNKVGEKIPFLRKPYSNVDMESELFYADENCIQSKSGSLKIRPFENEASSIRFKWLNPRPSTQYAWQGPSMVMSFLVFSGVVKYIKYLLDNYDATEKPSTT